MEGAFKKSIEQPSGTEQGPEGKHRGYAFEAFKQYEPMFTSLVGKLKPGIEAGTWGTLISDDAGGRLVTLALRRVMERASGTAPDTFFVPAGRNLISRGITAEHRAKLKEHVRKEARALIVSEYAFTGRSLGTLTGMLKKMGIDADIALGASKVEAGTISSIVHELAFQSKKKRMNVFVGTEEVPEPLMDFASWRFSGAEKLGDPQRLRSEKSSVPPNVARTPEGKKAQESIQHAIDRSRADAALMADRAYEAVWGAEEEQQEAA